MRKLKEVLESLKKINKKKLLGIVVIAFIIGIMAWAFISASILTANFDHTQVKVTQNEQKIDAVGIIITETKDGNKYFEIYGETGSYTNELNIATLNNVVGNFYKDGQVAMSFQSSKGTYDESAGTITLFENTYIVLQDSTSLEADKLTWYGSDKETVAEGNVKIKKSNEMVSFADKCIIGANYDKFKIVGKTKTSLYSKDSSKS